jgi:hypothetical protein
MSIAELLLGISAATRGSAHITAYFWVSLHRAVSVEVAGFVLAE